MDSVVLEIVSEAEIPQHFKEGVVSSGVAHIFKVIVLAACPHATLRRGGARIRPRFLAGEHILELHHSRIRKEQGRVVTRHQRRGRNDRMALGLEELQEFLANLGGFHCEGNIR